MKLDQLNQLSESRAYQEFYKCCACKKFCTDLTEARPYNTKQELFTKAESLWSQYTESEFLEAFRGHSKIGDLSSLKAKYANTTTWSQQEQAGMQGVNDLVLRELLAANDEYESKFGFIFIVCATGKSAIEMLQILKSRLQNERNQELQLAAAEQSKITRIRLEKLL